MATASRQAIFLRYRSSNSSIKRKLHNITFVNNKYVQQQQRHQRNGVISNTFVRSITSFHLMGGEGGINQNNNNTFKNSTNYYYSNYYYLKQHRLLQQQKQQQQQLQLLRQMQTIISKGNNEKTSTSTSTSTSKTKDPDSFKVTKVSYKHGDIKTINITLSEILKRTSILPRDLVSLDLTARNERPHTRRRNNKNNNRGKHFMERINYPKINRPPTAILPRTDSILLSFGNIRAVASCESVYLLDAHQPVVKEFAKELSTIYKEYNSSSTTTTTRTTLDSIITAASLKSDDEILAPELIFLEAVLRDTCDTFHRRIRILEPIVDDFLSRVANEVFSDVGLYQLVPLKDSLQSFELQVQKAYQCLTDLLNDDEEMVKLLLTEQQEALECGTIVDVSNRHQYVELLLGGYTRQISNTLQEIRYLLQRLQSKQEFVALALAGYRNRMVRMNVIIGITGVSIGITTAIAGFFGMNLISGLETSPNMFTYAVLGSSFTSILVSSVSLNYVLSGRSTQQRAKQRLEEIETVTGALSDMCALDYSVKQMMIEQQQRLQQSGYDSSGYDSDGSNNTNNNNNDMLGMDKEEFKQKLLESRQSGKITDREVDFLFTVLDTYKDGQLNSKDFSSNQRNKF